MIPQTITITMGRVAVLRGLTGVEGYTPRDERQNRSVDRLVARQH